MGQTCQKNTNKNHKQIKVPVIEPPYGIVEEVNVDKNGQIFEIVDVVAYKDVKNEQEIVLIPQNQTCPETNEQKNNSSSSNHQLSNSITSSVGSLSGLEVDEGENRTNQMKLFFDEEIL